MKTIIADVAEKFKTKAEEFFASGRLDIDDAEAYWSREICDMVLQLLSAYYEKRDAELLADKKGRREAGLRVEHRNESRQVLTLLGELRYKRTYYRHTGGSYSHPVDELAGLESNQKVSGGVSLALVNTAISLSYAKSSQYVTDGRVSRQTVLHKVRASRPKDIICAEKKPVSVLHIDADEDHVHLQNGKSAIIPLISVYEGISRKGKRGCCKNIHHYSQFNKKPEELWEEVLTDLERRYDLEHARLYLHGDGAAWIRQGLEWLPNCQFVLDRYHKNKAIKQLTAGIPRVSGCQYERQVREALAAADYSRLCTLRDRMLRQWPERKENILSAMNYLLAHFDAISIIQTDTAAAMGGATEPHVSHILSSRLSSRPMGWSAATLERLVPLLAAGEGQITLEAAVDKEQTPQSVCAAVWKNAVQRRPVPFSAGLPHPELAVSFPAKAGKITPLFRALRRF